MSKKKHKILIESLGKEESKNNLPTKVDTASISTPKIGAS